MNDLIELLTEGLTKLREDFNSLPNYEEQLSSIALQLNQLQENQLTKDNLKSTIDLLMSGYLATTKDEYLVMINALIEDIKTNNQTFLTNEIDNISNQVDTLIANAISSMKDELNQFKSTIKNGKDGVVDYEYINNSIKNIVLSLEMQKNRKKQESMDRLKEYFK